jgi:hypothetical protein
MAGRIRMPLRRMALGLGSRVASIARSRAFVGIEWPPVVLSLRNGAREVRGMCVALPTKQAVR